MPTRPRKHIDAGPSVTPLPYGLWSVVQEVPEGGDDQHWRNGVQFQADACEPAGSTQGPCPDPDDASPDYGKPATSSIVAVGGDPFTVYSWVDCGPIGGNWDAARARAAAALTAGEARAVEEVFWTGTTTTGPVDAVHPHLAADTEVWDPDPPNDDGRDVLVQLAADVQQTGPVDVVEAIGLLESAMGSCYGGAPVIHVPRAALPHLVGYGQVVRQGQQLRTIGGSLVAAGAGYPGTGPDGAQPAYPAAWFYATGAIQARRGPIEFTGSRQEALDRGANRLVLLAERTYVLAWDCCLIAVQAHLGGRPGGAPDSANPLP